MRHFTETLQKTLTPINDAKLMTTSITVAINFSAIFHKNAWTTQKRLIHRVSSKRREHEIPISHRAVAENTYNATYAAVTKASTAEMTKQPMQHMPTHTQPTQSFKHINDIN